MPGYFKAVLFLPMKGEDFRRPTVCHTDSCQFGNLRLERELALRRLEG
jgi:hypothetical protein